MGIGEYNFQNTNSMKRKETKFFKGVIQLWPENGCFSSKVKYVSWRNLWLHQNELCNGFREVIIVQLRKVFSLYYASRRNVLTRFRSMFPFYTPLKTSQNICYSDFFRGIEREHWPEMQVAKEMHCHIENLFSFSGEKYWYQPIKFALYLYGKVSMPAHRFRSSDWPILEILITHVTNVL